MGNTLIVTTGNTGLVSELVGGVMCKKGFRVTVKNAVEKIRCCIENIIGKMR